MQVHMPVRMHSKGKKFSEEKKQKDIEAEEW